MNRIIIDYKKLTPEILTLLTQKYPDGYGDNDIITFKNLKNESIEAVEVKTDENIYLVKVSTKLLDTMADFDSDDDDDISDDLPEVNDLEINDDE